MLRVLLVALLCLPPLACNLNSCPDSKPIKGNRDSMIYHVPGGKFYDKTNPEECFATEGEAQTAGYRRSLR